ncbi:MAG: hypothetical protein C4523_05640 [Myxococcales bacterium]|nr:MAG: hypothetical protein C4523_05640 [Myxococcales bacterium]
MLAKLITPFAWLIPLLLIIGCSSSSSNGDPAADGDTDADAGDVESEQEADANGENEADGDAEEGPPRFEPIECPEVEGTAMNLREKAAAFDAVARRWHLPAGQDLWFGVLLMEDLQTFDTVDMSDNVGTWTALYSASQSFRYAATRDPEALENLRRVMRGEHDMLRITGVRGLFTRAFVNPELPGFPTPEQLENWYPECDLSVEHCKRFNEVTEGEFAGWWFKNDVSKDEYAAHMFSMAVALEIVDDPEVREHAAEIVKAVGDHLVDNTLKLVDIDGQVTTFGHLTPYALDDFPGFNALLALSWVRMAAAVGGEKYQSFYDDCLLQKNGANDCIPGEPDEPFTSHLSDVGLDLDCTTNWNNHNMAQLSMYALLRTESDPALKAIYQDALRDSLWDADDPRPMSAQENSLYTFFYLVNKKSTDPWPEEAARKAICSLNRYPESKEHRPVDTLSRYTEVCRDRSDDPLAGVLIPIEERKADNFQWIGNPYLMEQEDGNPAHVESPEDYLLAYWMGRYFGFIGEDM